MKRAYGLASRAVLIGSTGGHQSRRAVIKQRLDDLSKLLADELRWSRPHDHLTVLLDPATPGEVDLALEDAGDKVGIDGLLLVYYIGPVLLGQDNTLSLVLSGTNLHDLADTAVPFHEVRWRVRENDATWRVLMLDCHDLATGTATNGAAAIADAAVMSLTSVVVHTATDHDHPGFTAALVDVMTRGLPSGPSLLDVRQLHAAVAERLAEAGSTAPELRIDSMVEPAPLIRNLALYRPDPVGQVLYAAETTGDEELAGAVVLILRHDPKTGCIGVVINRPGAAPAHPRASTWSGTLAEPAVVFDGGPAQHEGYISLALLRQDAAAPLRFRPVTARVGTIALSVPVHPAVERFRLFRGYVGWPAGGLETDLARELLVPTDAPADLAFSDDPAGLWQRVQVAP
jgi:putative transcriptional regulator